MINDIGLKTLFLGLGNEILSDDAAGIRLLEEIQPYIKVQDCFFETSSSGGLELLEMIRDYDTVIILDAMRTGKFKPGTVILASPDDFTETSNISSVHDLGFIDALRMAEQLGMRMPSRIHIIGVEIVEDLVFSERFSEPVFSAWPEIIRKVREIISGLSL